MKRGKFHKGNYKFTVMDSYRVIITQYRVCHTRRECEAFMQGLVNAMQEINQRVTSYEWSFEGEVNNVKV